jgi:hypothetical protein
VSTPDKETEQKPRRVGDGTPGPGRPKGVPNRVTTEFREAVRRLLEDNSENFGIWLKQVAEGYEGQKGDPGKALDLVAKLAEYAAPKLARTEIDANLRGVLEFRTYDQEAAG